MQRKGALPTSAIMAVAGFLLVVTTIVFSADSAFALDPIPQESGFSGYIGPGVGVAKYKGNMIAGLDKINIDFGDDKTNSLTSEADSNTTGIALLNFELGYNFAESRTRVFIGSTLEDFIQFDLGQQLGVRQEIGDMGILSAGFLLSNIPITVWKDPYLTNTARKDTRRKSTGARLVWDKIMGSRFELQFDYRKIDIDDEESGTSLGLTSSQRDRLDRDGELFKSKLQYTFKLADRHFLAPVFIYTRDDRDGSAMSCDIYDFQLTYLYYGSTISFVGNAMVGRADYDKSNPVPQFNYRTREDDRYGLTATLFYKNPFGWELFGSDKISFYGTVAHFVSDSNIDFYTSEITLGTLGVMYRF